VVEEPHTAEDEFSYAQVSTDHVSKFS